MMDIHEEIYRNKTPDAVNLEGKATPDSGIDVSSFVDGKDVAGEIVRPEIIIEESEGEKSSPRSGCADGIKVLLVLFQVKAQHHI